MVLEEAGKRGLSHGQAVDLIVREWAAARAIAAASGEVARSLQSYVASLPPEEQVEVRLNQLEAKVRQRVLISQAAAKRMYPKGKA